MGLGELNVPGRNQHEKGGEGYEWILQWTYKLCHQQHAPDEPSILVPPWGKLTRPEVDEPAIGTLGAPTRSLICLVMVKKASATLELALAEVSRKGIPSSSARFYEDR